MRYDLEGGYYMYPNGAIFNKRNQLLKRRINPEGEALIRFYINGQELTRSLKFIVADAYIEPNPLKPYVKQKVQGNDYSVANLYRSMWK